MICSRLTPSGRGSHGAERVSSFSGVPLQTSNELVTSMFSTPHSNCSQWHVGVAPLDLTGVALVGLGSSSVRPWSTPRSSRRQRFRRQRSGCGPRRCSCVGTSSASFSTNRSAATLMILPIMSRYHLLHPIHPSHSVLLSRPARHHSGG